MRYRHKKSRRARAPLPKWWSYAALLALFFFLERCVTNQFPLGSVCPVLVPLAVAALAFWEGSYAGGVAGLCLGSLSALTLGGGNGNLVWEYTAIGILVGATVNQTFGRSFWGFALCSVGVELFLEGLELLARVLFLRQEAGAVWAIAWVEGAYSLAFVPLIYLLFRRVHRAHRTEMEF